MTLTFYNTLARHKESFTPIESGKVRMYCCGITVYDYCHLGHARTCLIWDVARRYLQWRGYDVTYIQNFTDIDDKILNRARTEGVPMEEVSERFIAAYFEDMARLNIGEADAYPRATHTLDGIKRLVHELEQKGYAYPAQGDVYYRVRQFADYGKLSGRKLEDMQAGASGRVAVDTPEEAKKKDPFDFALWKASKPGEPAWESPWGSGRPGWHIECSAMVRSHLGETIDIHVGGSDLVFPHHENEIAQSEAATGKPLARYWLHNGMVMVNGEKMSKSLGNFTTIRDLLDGKWWFNPDAPRQSPIEAMAVRLFILQAHYRKPLDFTEEALEAATNGWQTLKEGLLFGDRYGHLLNWDNITTTGPNHWVERFTTAIDEDLNFAGGLAVLFEIAKELRKARNIIVHSSLESIQQSPQRLKILWTTLTELASVLGFKLDNNTNRPLKGKNLLNKVEELKDLTDRDKIEHCGYNSKTNFYKELLIAHHPDESKPEKPLTGSQLVKKVKELYSLPSDKEKAIRCGYYKKLKNNKINARVADYYQALYQASFTAHQLSDADIEALIQKRAEARKARNFAESDRIRDELSAQGITLIDQPGGVTKWHR